MRYPGGKTKLAKQILPFLLQSGKSEYCEPFVGGGGLTTAFLKSKPSLLKRVRINDLDHGIYCIWSAILNSPEDLKQLIREYTPIVEDFEKFKQVLLNSSDGSIVETAFTKIAVHQISYSGLGVMSGGPLGGRDQKSKYKIDCRWSPDSLCRKIDENHELLANYDTEITSIDFEDHISQCRDAVIFADPPYYAKGGDLYCHAFSTEDHARLQNVLAMRGETFFLTYDDCPEIRSLYDGFNIQSTDVNYTITTSRTKPELFITSCELP